jgi:FkbM family methyltransferase
MTERVPIGEYARPAKWRNAARRRVFLRRLKRRVAVRADCATAYLGTEYGGWPVPLDVLDRGSVAYSVGAGGDVSFDLELIRRVGCEVHSFDPTSGAAEHVAGIEEPRFVFHPVAVWLYDGVIEMFVAADPGNMALSAVNLQNTRRSVTVPCRTMETIRRELGHAHIDLVKLTIDGGEYELVPTLDLEGWRTRVLVVALHHNEPARRASELIGDLHERGFDPVARKGASGFTFLHPRGLRVRPTATAPRPARSPGSRLSRRGRP